MPLYYFEPERPGWSACQDDDGVELKGNAEALIYAYKIIQELKADRDGDHPTHLLVKNAARKTIFRIAVE